jgi:hypothetical protein
MNMYDPGEHFAHVSPSLEGDLVKAILICIGLVALAVLGVGLLGAQIFF